MREQKLGISIFQDTPAGQNQSIPVTHFDLVETTFSNGKLFCWKLSTVLKETHFSSLAKQYSVKYPRMEMDKQRQIDITFHSPRLWDQLVNT